MAPDRATWSVTLLYPASEFGDVVALSSKERTGSEADPSEVRIVRSERRRYVYFVTRTPQAFLGPRRVRADDLRRASQRGLTPRTCNFMSAVCLRTRKTSSQSVRMKE